MRRNLQRSVRLSHVPQLLELYKTNPYVSKLFKSLESLNDQEWENITPERIQVIVGCSRALAIQTMKELDQTKVADFITGRKGHKTRLAWETHWGENFGRVVIEELNKQFETLVEKADRGDKKAQNDLETMAVAALEFRETTMEKAKSVNWVTVAKLIVPGNLGIKASLFEPVNEPVIDKTNSESKACDKGAHDIGELFSEIPNEEEAAGEIEKSEVPKFVDMKILLRPDLWVKLSFPENLTEYEAKRLAGVVSNLWLVPSKCKPDLQREV
jgi:hypothetical protein